ncbi:MAG: acyl-CoA synthetase [Geminicoccaceae bacterium]
MDQRVAHPETSPYRRGLGPAPANEAPLTPLVFLDRAADIYPDRIAIVHGDKAYDYRTFRARCRRLASALRARGVEPGDTVSLLAPNIPAAVEAAYGVPMAGAVLNALNIRLDAETIGYILDHGEAKVLLTDTEFSPVVEEALRQCTARPLVVDIEDLTGPGGGRLGELTYEDLLAEGDPEAAPLLPADEWQAISLNYTSGTTGKPKGVVYHHRGAWLNAVGNTLVWDMGDAPVYLWTLPTFHCNGWCFPWTIAAKAGTQVCLRKVASETIIESFVDHGVTHLCGAPVVMSMIINAPEDLRQKIPPGIKMMTAASAPPAAVLAKMAALGIEVTHVYGLTEVYGPATVCAWQEAWSDLSTDERAGKIARQGVRYPVLAGLDVLEPQTMQPVPRDGATIGEIMMQGHIVMSGYFKDEPATAKAFAGGWFHTGDLAVTHDDGYVEIKDRSKDIIISGGENISSIEIEGALHRHQDVIDAAVVARPDERWGETPCAFVTLRPGSTVDETGLIDHCRQHLASFKLPKTVVFGELPKTSTGKVQKTKLREQARRL